MLKRILVGLIVVAVTAGGGAATAISSDPAYRLDLSDNFRPKLVLGVYETFDSQRIDGEFYFYCQKGNLQAIAVRAIIRSVVAASLYDQAKVWAIGFSDVATILGSAPGVEKEAGLQRMGFEHTLELSADTTKSYDLTAISDQPDILYLSGFLEIGDFQRWISSATMGTLFYDQSKKQWWVFTRSPTKIAQDDLQRFLRACVG